MAGDELRYVVHGRPQTWKRTADYRGRRITEKAHREALRAHALAAIAALGTRRAAWSLDGAFLLGVSGYWPDARAGDFDRLMGMAMDALKGVAYRDDKQVRGPLPGGVFCDGSPPRVEVRLVRLAVDPVQSAVARRAAQGGGYAMVAALWAAVGGEREHGPLRREGGEHG
jgi:hypothetical protein